MTIQEVINQLYEAGLSVVLEQGERINLKPTNLVTPVLVNLVKFHKQALIKYFKEKVTPKTTKPKLLGFHQIYDSDPLLKALLELGEQICDYWNDSEEARTEMVADIFAYPLHQRKALLAALASEHKVIAGCTYRAHLPDLHHATLSAKLRSDRHALFALRPVLLCCILLCLHLCKCCTRINFFSTHRQSVIVKSRRSNLSISYCEVTAINVVPQ